MNNNTLRDIEREIAEIYAMIDHFIMLGNKEEIAYWRITLQRAKKMKLDIKRNRNCKFEPAGI